MIEAATILKTLEVALAKGRSFSGGWACWADPEPIPRIVGGCSQYWPRNPKIVLQIILRLERQDFESEVTKVLSQRSCFNKYWQKFPTFIVN